MWCNPLLRDTLLAIQRSNEQTIDRVSIDTLLGAGYSQEALDKARSKIDDFKRFIEDHQDELTALQVFYGRVSADRMRFKDLNELAARIATPPLSTTPEELWRCYEQLDRSRVNGTGGKIITDLVSIVRHTLRPAEPLTPFAQVVQERHERRPLPRARPAPRLLPSSPHGSTGSPSTSARASPSRWRIWRRRGSPSGEVSERRMNCSETSSRSSSRI